MPLDARFYETVAPLCMPGMGTEEVGPLLYSLVRMTRPHRALEVGLGYTSAFLAQALADNVVSFESDREIVRTHDKGFYRATLSTDYHQTAVYAPTLHAIDDYSLDGRTSAPQVLEALEKLGLRPLVTLWQGDFRGKSAEMGLDARPLDFVWFDCGGIDEFVDFINEYWDLITLDNGMLLLHFTYWTLEKKHSGPRVREQVMVMGSIANEIKRQQLSAGLDAPFELLSLVEPHKSRQGSVTMIRRVTPQSMARPADFQTEVSQVFGERPKPIRKL